MKAEILIDTYGRNSNEKVFFCIPRIKILVLSEERLKIKK